MQNKGKVQGSITQAQPLIIGKTTIYVHTNITPITTDRKENPIEGLYEYDEIQYTKDEYLALLDQQLNETNEILTNTQLALVELYETKEGK